MKCANCGKEFGSGSNCQNCGIDRVAGLANYSGYNSPEGSNSYDFSSYGEQSSSKTTVCFACSEIIPLGSTFCPVCGKKLLVTCPNCGHEYSSQYPVCSKCGTNRELYLKGQERNKIKIHIERAKHDAQRRTKIARLLGFVLIIIGLVLVSAALNNDMFGLGILLTLPFFGGGIFFMVGAYIGDPYEKEIEQQLNHQDEKDEADS